MLFVVYNNGAGRNTLYTHAVDNHEAAFLGGFFIKTYDRVLTKTNHCGKILIEKIRKAIIQERFCRLDITLNDIDIYLADVKDAIQKNRYRIDRNARRQDNINLFIDFVIDETMAKDILLGLTATDFSEILQNEHKGFEHEKLYVFGKDVELLEKIGNESKLVHLYIKINKLANCFVIVISMHEQKYPIKYFFK